MAFLGYRFTGAALLAALIFRRQLAQLPADGYRAGAAMGVFLTAGYAFQTLGLERTTASRAGFITGLFVVLTPVLGALVLRERAPRAAWLAAAASALGLYLLAAAGDGGGSTRAGDALELLCAAAFAGHVLATGKGVARYPIGALLAIQLGVCGLFSLAVAAVSRGLAVPRGMTVWSALLVTALLASLLGQFVQSFAQRHSSPTRTAVILTAEPVFAGLFGVILAGDRLTPLGWVGAVIIVAAIVGTELSDAA